MGGIESLISVAKGGCEAHLVRLNIFKSTNSDNLQRVLKEPPEELFEVFLNQSLENGKLQWVGRLPTQFFYL